MIVKGKVEKVHEEEEVLISVDLPECKRCSFCNFNKNSLLRIKKPSCAVSNLQEMHLKLNENCLLLASFFIYGLPVIGALVGISLSVSLSLLWKVIFVFSGFVSGFLVGLKLSSLISSHLVEKIF